MVDVCGVWGYEVEFVSRCEIGKRGGGGGFLVMMMDMTWSDVTI